MPKPSELFNQDGNSVGWTDSLKEVPSPGGTELYNSSGNSMGRFEMPSGNGNVGDSIAGILAFAMAFLFLGFIWFIVKSLWELMKAGGKNFKRGNLIMAVVNWSVPFFVFTAIFLGGCFLTYALLLERVIVSNSLALEDVNGNSVTVYNASGIDAAIVYVSDEPLHGVQARGWHGDQAICVNSDGYNVLQGDWVIPARGTATFTCASNDGVVYLYFKTRYADGTNAHTVLRLYE